MEKAIAEPQKLLAELAAVLRRLDAIRASKNSLHANWLRMHDDDIENVCRLV
jgi:hypothetical protein